MIVTTAGRTNLMMIKMAEMIAFDLKAEYKPRKKKSVNAMKEAYHSDVLVVGQNRLELHELNTPNPFFFHPNSAMFRLKRVQKGESDPLLAAADLKKGDRFLDCTLGLGSDSIIASFAVGEKGIVTAAEARKLVAYLVKTGLNKWETGISEFDESMRRINVTHINHLDYLKSLNTNAFDIVYFDPMFDEEIEESNGIEQLRTLSFDQPLTDEVIREAKRVAAKRVVLKNHWKSPSFDSFGFEVFKRKTAKFHFGVIEMEDS
ncbi:class I SAM-dependent methyltransferase [Metabacillus idriensis]|uniref:class I SAM-dependent methyltransferase n=1 Tax=Metabacillus idriensis TaxID=324768 RepID=UPI00174C8B75|nr:class I SAM-dependent methyltransferase [Metabacillus idriensis]